MTTDKQDSKTAFIATGMWPNEVMWANWDKAWQASRKQMREDVIQELSGMSCNNATAKSAIKLCIEAIGGMK